MKPINITPMLPEDLEHQIEAISTKLQNESLDRAFRKALFDEMVILIKSRSRETVTAMERARGLAKSGIAV